MKNTKKTVVRIVALFFAVMIVFALFSAFIPKKEEEKILTPYEIALKDYEENGLKGMWVAYIDYYSVDFSTEETFTADITEMFTNIKSMGLNTAIVHARSFGDAFYKSEIFPQSHIMTGKQGGQVDYDPLEIMVEKAHEIGLRIEAWVNPYRVSLNGQPKEFSADNPAVLHPEFVKETEDGIFYNPALPQVHELITDGVLEIVNNYDVDGIHFDDYFYPTTDESFDAENYSEYKGDLSLEDWRRENVNTLVKKVYAAVKNANPDVVFGISPQGNDNNNYNVQYSDVGLWMREDGYVDYVMPQLYWGFEHRMLNGSDEFSFEKITKTWSDYPKSENVKLYVGLGAYRIGQGEESSQYDKEWHSGENIAKMIDYVNKSTLDGYAIYTYNSMFIPKDHPDLQAKEVMAVTELNTEKV